MLADEAVLARLLEGGVLGGRPVVRLGGDTLAVRCTSQELWSAWQAGRSIVQDSGRWPVLIAGVGEYSQDPWSNEPVGDPAVEEWASSALAAAEGLDPWTVFVRYEGYDAASDPLHADLVRVVAGYDPLLTAADTDALLAAHGTVIDLERLRLDRRIAASEPGKLKPQSLDDTWTDRDTWWYVPHGESCAVVFLPTALTWQSGAYLSYFGALGPEREAALIAAQRQWAELYGAELVASWGTMLQFIVQRPPSTVPAAWELAGQQLAVGGSMQIDQSDLAIMLMTNNFWFLHDRP